jgi:putative spermidine/putrescine transport system substrate-binding protein
LRYETDSISRRSALLVPAAGLAMAAIARRSRAENRTVTLVTWGGSVQAMLERDGFAQKFTDATGFRVVLVPKSTGPEIVATAMAQRARPQVDVVMTDLLPWIAAADQGLFEPLEPNSLPNLGQLYESGKLIDPKTGALRGIAPIADIFALIYNKELFAQKGWAPPTSWQDLERPELKGQLLIPPGTATYGLYALILQARAHGGSEANIEPGFAAMKRIAPGVFDWSDTIAKISQFLQDGSGAVAFYTTASGADMAQRGLPVVTAVPQPAMLTKWAMSLMKGAPNPEGGRALMNWFISPDVMAYRADRFSNTPMNKEAPLSVSARGRVPSREVMEKAQEIDYYQVLSHREEWVQRFQREIAPLR